MAYIFGRRTAPVMRCGIFNQSSTNYLKVPAADIFEKGSKDCGISRTGSADIVTRTAVSSAHHEAMIIGVQITTPQEDETQAVCTA